MGQVPPDHILTHEDASPRADRAGGASGALRVVLAPNAFKGSLPAAGVAAAMAQGVRRVAADAEIALAPMADGGDGSVDAFVAAGYDRVPVVTRGPTGEPVGAAIAVLGRRAIVELASTCGLALLPGGVPAPMTSTTLGLGDALLVALDLGCDDLVVCLGGSASTDGGTGLLVALGARLTDGRGATVPPGGAGLADIARLDLSRLDPRLAEARVTVAADVTSPLCGPEGAASTFSPQKGASPGQVAALDAGLARWARVLAEATGRDVGAVPGAGAAGGTAAALLATCAASITPGARVVADLVGLDAHLATADLVITGEGRLDRQSALGKAVVDVLARANAAGVPALAVCGRIDLATADLAAAGFAAWADCVTYAGSEAASIDRVRELVEQATAAALRSWLATR